MGGDRDGNPNVTASVTSKVVTLMRARAADCYYREVEKLLFELSHTGPVTSEMAAEVAKYTAGAPGGKVFPHQGGYGVHWTFQSGCQADEPYRVLLMALRRRLYKTRALMERVYLGETPAELGSDPDVVSSSKDLLEPLELMYRSLVAVGDAVLAEGTLIDFIRRVRTFGISMARLDLRQESDRHAEAIDAITRFLGVGSFLEWDEPSRVAWLEAELVSRRPLIPTDYKQTLGANDKVVEVLDTFHMLASFPPECMGAYCISMAHAASDVLAVRLLQVKCGVAHPMRVAPLFETREDLQVSSTRLDSTRLDSTRLDSTRLDCEPRPSAVCMPPSSAVQLYALMLSCSHALMLSSMHLPLCNSMLSCERAASHPPPLTPPTPVIHCLSPSTTSHPLPPVTLLHLSPSSTSHSPSSASHVLALTLDPVPPPPPLRRTRPA